MKQAKTSTTWKELRKISKRFSFPQTPSRQEMPVVGIILTLDFNISGLFAVVPENRVTKRFGMFPEKQQTLSILWKWLKKKCIILQLLIL